MRISVTRNYRKRIPVELALLSLLLASCSCTCDSAPFRRTSIIVSKAIHNQGPTAVRALGRRGNRQNNQLFSELRGGSTEPTEASKSTTTSKKKRKKSKPKTARSSSSSSASAGSIKTKKKAKKKQGETSSSSNNGDGKDAINAAMGKDSAEALADSIRERADELRAVNPLLERIDQSVYSVGWALGASDRVTLLSSSSQPIDKIDNPAAATDDDGGVAGSPTSVLVSYFLKSHGGAHALQCVCSLLATSAGFASLVLPSTSPMRRVLIKRTLLFAMTKHVAGLLGAAMIAAKAIPEVGLRKARVWMEQLARDPVSQYVFYSACLLLWLPKQSQQPLVSSLGSSVSSWLPMILVLPILLREVVSTMLVISDVLVLWATSSSSTGVDDPDVEDNNNGGQEVIETILQVSQKAVNIVMSLLVSPDRWKLANPAGRQLILAKLTSQVSLALEVVVGMIMTMDAMIRMSQFVFGTTGSSSAAKPAFLSVVKRLLCSRVYLQFLWSRRRKINKLAVNIRGGSTQLPFYVLDVLMDPMSAMGLHTQTQQDNATSKLSSSSLPKSKRKPLEGSNNSEGLNWKDYLALFLGLDDDK